MIDSLVIRMLAQIRLALLLLLAVCGVGFGGCAPTVTTSDVPLDFGEIDESLGDVKVWFKQMPLTGIRGAHGARVEETEIILVNISHSHYQNVSSDRLLDSERVITDAAMRRLLDQFAEEGVRDKSSGAMMVNLPPDQFAKTVTKRLHMWIGIETKPPGAKAPSYVFFPKYIHRPEELKGVERQHIVFNNCILRINTATANTAGYKDRSRGTTAEDLRSSARDNARLPGLPTPTPGR